MFPQFSNIVEISFFISHTILWLVLFSPHVCVCVCVIMTKYGPGRHIVGRTTTKAVLITWVGVHMSVDIYKLCKIMKR